MTYYNPYHFWTHKKKCNLSDYHHILAYISLLRVFTLIQLRLNFCFSERKIWGENKVLSWTSCQPNSRCRSWGWSWEQWGHGWDHPHRTRWQGWGGAQTGYTEKLLKLGNIKIMEDFPLQHIAMCQEWQFRNENKGERKVGQDYLAMLKK